MNDVRLERLLDDVLADISALHVPDRLGPDIAFTTSHIRQRPRWLALIKEPPMRHPSGLAVGSPAVRLAYLMVLSLLMALLAVGGVVAGASVLPSPSPMPAPCGDVVCDTAPLAEGRSGHTATRLADGSVLVIGGATEFWRVFPLTAELWDPATETFRPAGSLAEGRQGHSATLLPDGRILVVGGYAAAKGSADVMLASAEVWDPATETFTATGSLALGRAGHGDAVLPDGRVLIIAGWSGGPAGNRTDTTEIWDPDTGTFSPGPPLGEERGGLATVSLDGGGVLAVGGSLAVSTTAELLDPATISFSPAGSFDQRGDFTASFLADGRVLVVGGPGGPSGTVAQIWDPATGSFTATGSPMEAYASWQTETLLDDGRVLIVSGPGEVWDPTTGQFGAVGPTMPGLGQQSATLLKDGRVLVVGGFDGTSKALDAAALWDLRGVVGQLSTASVSPAP
jgi:WD40 repeat protein